MLYVHLVALAIATSALAASGCGGSSKSTASSDLTTSTASGSTTAVTKTSSTIPQVAHVSVSGGKPLTKTLWVSKGNAICRHLHAELETLKIKKTAELPRVLPQAAAYERDAVNEFAKLVPPRSKTNDWEQFVTGTLQWAEGSAKVAEEAKLGDAITQSPAASATLVVQRQLSLIAGRDGLVACVNL